MTTQKYFIRGWIPIDTDEYNIMHSDYEEKIWVTRNNEIKIYLPRGNSLEEPHRGYHKIYKSLNGFTKNKICLLSYFTFIDSINELDDGYNSWSNRSICGFEFDEQTSSVYPIDQS